MGRNFQHMIQLSMSRCAATPVFCIKNTDLDLITNTTAYSLATNLRGGPPGPLEPLLKGEDGNARVGGTDTMHAGADDERCSGIGAG